MESRNHELTDRSLFPVGVNVFVLRDGMLLLGKRKSDYHDGAWGVPGGHLEAGESMRECAARELMEETGLSAGSFAFTVADNDPRKDRYHYIHFGFMAEGVVGEPALMEPEKCYEWRWFPLNDLPDPIFVGHQRLIQGLLEKTTFLDSEAAILQP